MRRIALILALAFLLVSPLRAAEPVPEPTPPGPRTQIDLATQAYGSLPCVSLPILSGDVSSAGCLLTVSGLNGYPVSSATPSTGQFLGWDGNSWTPTDAPSGSFAAGQDLSGSASAQTVIGLRARPVNSAAPNTNDVLTWTGTQWAPVAPPSGSFAAGGDLSGTSSSQTVTGLRGRTVSAAAPLTNQYLGWDGAQWIPSTPAGAGNVSNSGTPAAHQVGIWVSSTGIKGVAPTSTPSQCFMSDASAPTTTDPSFRTCPNSVTFGGDLSGSLTTQTVIRLQGRSVSSAVPGAGQALEWNGTAWAPTTLATGSFTAGGDLSGTNISQTVIRLQGRAMAATAPLTNQALAWNGSAWVPTTISTSSFTAGGDLSGTISSQTVTGLRGHSVNFTGAITTGVLVFWDGTQFNVGLPGIVVNNQTGTSYSVVGTSSGSSGDLGKLLTLSNGSPVAVALAQCGSTGFGAGFMFYAHNRGAGTVTITPSTSTIDGSSSKALTTGQSAIVACSGTDSNYYTF